jgi:hypothetical protein
MFQHLKGKNMKIDLILSRLESVKNTGDNKWIARCPSHQDKSPSLAIKYTENKILLHCFAGCGADDVLAAIGLDFTALFDEIPGNNNKRVSKHNGFSADDVLLALIHEITIVGLAAGDISNGVEISSENLDRVKLASLRISEGVRFVNNLGA